MPDRPKHRRYLINRVGLLLALAVALALMSGPLAGVQAAARVSDKVGSSSTGSRFSVLGSWGRRSPPELN